jgi:hypothetical protein
MSKSTPVAEAFWIVTVRLAGMKICPGLDGDTVYVPLERPPNEYWPDALAVVVAVADPAIETVAPAPPGSSIDPEIAYVVGVAETVKLRPDAFAPAIVTFRLDGEKVAPAFEGMTA